MALDQELLHPDWCFSTQSVEPGTADKAISSDQSPHGLAPGEHSVVMLGSDQWQNLNQRDLSVKLGNYFCENDPTQVALQGVCQQGEVPVTLSAPPLAAALGNLSAAFLLGRKTSVHPQWWK